MFGIFNRIDYSFRAMAQDKVDVMKALGFDRFHLAGHDRGARTARRMCLDHPDKVERAAVLDILPNRHIWNNASKDWTMKSWHRLFMARPHDMPERMVAGVPAPLHGKKLSKKGIGLAPFTREALDEYVRCFKWKTIRGSCEDHPGIWFAMGRKTDVTAQKKAHLPPNNGPSTHIFYRFGRTHPEQAGISRKRLRKIRTDILFTLRRSAFPAIHKPRKARIPGSAGGGPYMFLYREESLRSRRLYVCLTVLRH